MHCPLPHCSVPMLVVYFTTASFVFHFPDCFVMFMKGFTCIRISCVLYVLWTKTRGKPPGRFCFYSKSLFKTENLTESLIQVISVELLICTIRASTLLLPLLFSIEKKNIYCVYTQMLLKWLNHTGIFTCGALSYFVTFNLQISCSIWR